MKNNWIKKLDEFKYGATLGLIFPFIGFLISFLVKGGDMDLNSYWEVISHTPNSSSIYKDIYIDARQSTLVFCLMPNMLLFYFGYFQFKIDKFSKGLVGVTLILAALSFLFTYQ